MKRWLVAHPFSMVHPWLCGSSLFYGSTLMLWFIPCYASSPIPWFIPDSMVHPFPLSQEEGQTKQKKRTSQNCSLGGKYFGVYSTRLAYSSSGVASRVFGYVGFISMYIINLLDHALRILTFRSRYVSWCPNVPTLCPQQPLRNDETWACEFVMCRVK